MKELSRKPPEEMLRELLEQTRKLNDEWPHRLMEYIHEAEDALRQPGSNKAEALAVLYEDLTMGLEASVIETGSLGKAMGEAAEVVARHGTGYPEWRESFRKMGYAV